MNILIAAGYDNALSISEFDEADIAVIESYAANNLQSLLKESKIYSNVEPFAFLPGHKMLLIGLPKQLHSFKNKKCRKNLFSTPKVQSQSNQQKEVAEILTDDEISALKDKLVKKLNKHAEAKGINKSFTINHIVGEIGTYISQSRSGLNKITYKCSVHLNKTKSPAQTA